ncbi:hypothetical protein JCM5350_005297 [Sporobolomyces pararoseus]
MPLQRRRPVPLLPVPDLTGLKEDDPVFYLKATGEIFLDYESYSSRLSFLLSKTFQCESSGKSHLDYFTALQSEKQESKTVRERFPNELKSRVLNSVQGLKIGRLDKLVELVFERYKDRFFKNEKVFVDLSGDKYYARIAKVFPPQSIRDKFLQSSSNSDDDDDFSSIFHKLGTDLSLDIDDDKQVKVLDPVEDYLYTVQLMDEEHKFEGSFMEVKQKNLSRDRLTFSKSILKRYMKECVTRETNSTTSPWIVKPSIAKALGIEPILLPTPTTTNDSDQKVDGGGGSKRGRKSNVTNVGGEETASKRRKMDASNSTSAGVTSTTTTTTSALSNNNNNEGPKKAIKYPIEDLDLDPMSIHDGRVLRRTKTEVPTLPPKPKPRRDLPTRDDKRLFDSFLESWNFLNTFSKPLSLSPFTMDDFIGALTHQARAKAKSGGVDCVLLAEIHACLTNVIGTDLSRVLGTSSISGLNGLNGKETVSSSGSGGGKKSSRNGNNGETTSRVGTPVPESNGGEEEVDELDDDNNNNKEEEEEEEVLTPEAIFFSKLIKRGIQYGKRWDRQAKLKAETGREGWERHLIGCVCQRGGAFYLEKFEEIMKHLFKGDPILNEEHQERQTTEKKVGENDDVEMKNGEKVREEEEEKKAAEESDEAPKSSQLSELEEEDEEQHLVDGPCPEDQYLTLPLADKLAIINYLITLVTATKPIRAYLEEADRELTDLRKQRADVNKEKKALLERKLNEGKKAAKTASSPTVNNDSRKSPAPSVSRATSPSIRNGDEDEDDELLTSDNESSVAPSEAGSVATRQTQKEEKLTQKRLSKLAATNSKSSSSSSSKTPLPSTTTKGGKSQSTNLSLDEQIEDNSQMEEFVEKQFRRYLGVSRCRPLGKDRFHCRYWWFDGIGGMEISKPKTDGTRVQYSTGKIFVQGPNEQDWEVLTDAKAEKNKEREIVERRMREEVVETEEALVGVNEWGFYETPEEIESLLGWLNSKGTRELGLIKAITRWKDYIVAGCQERYKDLENPSRPRYDPKTTSSGRPSRNKAENDLPSTYLGYRNELKKY